MPVADLDVYVDHAPKFGSARQYIVRRALEALGPAGLAYRTIDRGAPADLARAALVHVDLTVVPPRHRPPAGAHAVAWNAQALDITRTRYTTARLTPASTWAGPVIVKSVLNHRGLPEFAYRRRTDAAFRWRRKLLRLLGRDPQRRACPPYALHPSLADVPAATWTDPARIVERFLPGALALPVVKHRFDFFLDVELRTRAVFDDLLCDPARVREVTVVADVPDAIRRVRRDLHLDFGSIDYFVVDGAAVVVDANKTTTCGDDWIRAYPAVGGYVRDVGARLVEALRAGADGPAHARPSVGATS